MIYKNAEFKEIRCMLYITEKGDFKGYEFDVSA